MTNEEKILAKARELFDVCGATLQSDGQTLLILGMESTTEQNLDDFGVRSGHFIMYGFRAYAAPKLEALINYIHKKGFSAQLVGRYGYPLEGKINLKNEAIRAKLGKRGKNTVVLHPKYGSRLRFMGIYTSASLPGRTTAQIVGEYEFAACRNCSICVDICPVKALEPFRMAKPDQCLSNLSPQNASGHSVLCDKCLKECPAGNKARRARKTPVPKTKNQKK
ncbi:MAG: hypothetical protein WCS74_00720 [Dehalococcoidales bacterium]|jgi:epoxyqueuosine reductase QueG|nr:hypothetical protein [Dehalococcoidales bacterium]MDD3264542.1 hypothetical protein [Dehalococcoidales bacterium]MDD4322384.1 hypothetical protein [Dehalococcoidales bacterium]MDD4794018.1 hypothetical protein [Dehalococcoidales bacterium]MDD5122428.1 hypothetical protein [Dehalococcoidales bacterium]